jgi:hypothetical protein
MRAVLPPESTPPQYTRFLEPDGHDAPEKTYANVWDALADTPEQAADLMRQIAELI